MDALKVPLNSSGKIITLVIILISISFSGAVWYFLPIVLNCYSMAPRHKDGEVVVAISGTWISWTHTIAAYAAFLGALFSGLYLHYHKIVENEYYVGSHSARSERQMLMVLPRVTLMSGSLRFPPLLVTDTRSAPFSNSS